jgi:hypothetical protein
VSPPNANDALLASIARLYYSTTQAGLDGFDCAVHPEWREVLSASTKGAAVAATDPRVVLLNAVKITLHARFKTDSSVDWVQPANPAKPLDQLSLALLERMHPATEQTLQGFLQFWTPFVDGSTVPASSEGLQIVKTALGYTLRAQQNESSVTEQFDNRLLLVRFDVEKNGAALDFAPAYASTDRGLLVSGFIAHIQPQGATPEQSQQMNANIQYQTVDGFPVPSKLSIEVVGTGVLGFTFDGCSAIRSSN